MTFIKEEEIENIRNQADIVEIIGKYVSLKKNGNNYVGMCPFHDDHSPSMFVNPTLKIFKCFVCNAGGNVFSFIKRFENVSYPESVKIVAKESGIDFKYQIDAPVVNKFQNQFDLMDLSWKLYQNNIETQEGKKAKEYLLNRGIDDNIIKEFKLGLSLNKNQLRNYLENKKQDLELAYKIGLLNKDGIEYFDTFANRIMIPIIDMQGHLCGYTGRVYLDDSKNKYVNSKETDIYKKSHILFNYYHAKERARLNKEIIIVEGNMDVITLAHNGVKNVIALMGVVISKQQIDALKKLNCKIILMLDSDNAGSTSTIKIGDELYKNGLDVYVVRLSGSKDPDEYIRKNGVESLNNVIKHALKYLDYKFSYLKENKNLDNVEELKEYIKEVLSSIKDSSDLEKEITIKKLCNDYNLDPDILKKEVSFTANITIKPVAKVVTNKKKSRYHLAILELIYAMLINKDYYLIYMKNLGYLLNKTERNLVALIGNYIKKHGDIEVSGFIDYIIDYEDESNLLNEVMINNKKETVAEKEFYDILDTVSNLINEEEIKKIKKNIKEEMDVNKKLELIEKLTLLKKGRGNNEGNQNI